MKKNKQIRADCEKISTYSRRLVGFIVQIRCWNNVLSYTKQAEKMMEYGKELRKFLNERYGFEFIYEAMEIKIIDVPTLEDELISFEEVKEVFLKKVINLVKGKVKSEKYLKAQNKGEKFHYLCMLLFLREQWVEVDKLDLQRELDLIPFRLQEITDSYIEPKPLGFGNSQ